MLSGARFPGALGDQVRAAAGDAAAVREIGVQYAAAMCERLLAEGTPGLHFYTLNGSRATREIYERLGLAGRAAGGGAQPARLRLAAESCAAAGRCRGRRHGPRWHRRGGVAAVAAPRPSARTAGRFPGTGIRSAGH